MSHFVFPPIFSTLTLSITSNLQLITFRFYPLICKRVDCVHPVAAANTWRTQRPRGASGFRAAAQHSKEVRPKDYQGIIRCRAGVGKQGRHRGDGKPAGPDRPLGKGVGGIKKERAERRGLGQSPNEKNKTEGGKSSLGQPCCPIAAPLSREAQHVSC